MANDAAKHSSDAFGALKWILEVEGHTAHWNWLWAHALMVPIGSQTLATRGSEKSMYGKFFEKLVMGSVLEILGFSFDGKRSGCDMTYWLSERGETGIRCYRPGRRGTGAPIRHRIYRTWKPGNNPRQSVEVRTVC